MRTTLCGGKAPDSLVFRRRAPLRAAGKAGFQGAWAPPPSGPATRNPPGRADRYPLNSQERRFFGFLREMPTKKHHVKLTEDERMELSVIARKQGAAAIKVQRAKALLAVDCAVEAPGVTDLEAAAGSGL